MPNLSYLQAIARANSQMPTLLPPRSPLSRVEVSPITEIPAQPPVQQLPTVSRNIPEQLSLSPGLQEIKSLPPQPALGKLAADVTVASSVLTSHTERENPSVEPQPMTQTQQLKAQQPIAPIHEKNHQQPIAPMPEVPQQQPIAPTEELTTSVIQPTQLPDLRVTPFLPPEPNQAPAPQKPGSYLQTTAKTSILESRAPVSDPVKSEILQPPNPGANSQALILTPPPDRQPSPTPTVPGNTVHIGAMEIHIAPPPKPQRKPVATTPLARGFTSSFGLRQG